MWPAALACLSVKDYWECAYVAKWSQLTNMYGLSWIDHLVAYPNYDGYLEDMPALRLTWFDNYSFTNFNGVRLKKKTFMEFCGKGYH